MIKHVDDWKSLLDSIKTIKQSLQENTLVVIDSIAAPIRVINLDYRSKAIRLISEALLALCVDRKSVVLCANQVTQQTNGINEAALSLNVLH
ncbi:hypothetical protein GJ496_004498 [Pomphorhynchus laevis]|nr:hypothetical protein GJ496_004498 [Pomphorhynchus laevis]